MRSDKSGLLCGVVSSQGTKTKRKLLNGNKIVAGSGFSSKGVAGASLIVVKNDNVFTPSFLTLPIYKPEMSI